MERQFYADNVNFVDPLTSFTGIEKYQNNVDMLAGRTTLGKFLFEDANIVLHNIKDLGRKLHPNPLDFASDSKVLALEAPC